jgi:hypothetical protein
MNGEGFPCKVGGEEPRTTPVGKDTLNRQKFKAEGPEPGRRGKSMKVFVIPG